MKCGGDCTALTDGGEPVMQILVLDLWERIEAAEKLGAEARQIIFYLLFQLLFSFERMLHKSGDDSEKVTPVPIPNTEVKLLSADGSWDTRPCESRTLPGCKYGGLAQLGEHLPYKQRVGGSSPSSSTIFTYKYYSKLFAGVAQLVEQLTCN